MVNNLSANAGGAEDRGPIPGLENPLEEEVATHFSILAGNFHGQRSLEGCSPWGHNQTYSMHSSRIVHRSSHSIFQSIAKLCFLKTE